MIKLFAILQNGVLRYAPKKVNYNDSIVFNPTEEILKELGYKEVKNTEYPNDGKYYTTSYEEQDDKIVQVWTEAEEPVQQEGISFDEFLDIIMNGVD